ncbi:MAG: tetratricopeptide repeat protein [Nannocystaceae bacterium]|nr:tetratricopeptide repeat protein [Nannocystaceae bacterium]
MTARPARLAEDPTLVPSNQQTVSGNGEPRGPDDELARGTVISRYVVLQRVGVGGMGEVYAAYDPQLDRRVALKLLARARSVDTQGRSRMLREAQAMARLTHPNVVAVHDVGVHEQRTFIAMEFVQGTTIKAWLAEATRSWREVLAVYLQAGRGLAAAHAVGLVHRDFKPDNVMLALSPEGAVQRVLVTDFGLARETVDEIASTADGKLDRTDTVAFAGTPRYMAPEQFGAASSGRPGATGPWSDQFSFCVALYEGLWGQRPFEAESVAALAEAVGSGRVREPPRGGVPSRVRQAVLRGLQLDPAARHPSMAALLAVLEHDPARTRRAVIGIGFVVTTLAAAVTAQSLWDPSMRRCDRGADEIETVWNAERRDGIGEALARTQLPQAAAVWAEQVPRIDAAVASWREMFIDACAATHVRGEQSDERLDARMRCLQDRRNHLDGLLSEFEQADDELALRVESAVRRLPPAEDCRDPVAPPLGELDDDGRARVDAASRLLAIADARNDAGRYVQGVAATAAALSELGELEVPWLRGRVLTVRGQMQHRSGDSAAAEQSLREALRQLVPVQMHRDAALAWIELMFTVGSEQSKPTDALAMALPAELEIAAAGQPDELVRRYESVLATVYVDAGKPDEALAHHERALALAQAGSVDDSVRVVLSANYGNTLYALGRYRDAFEAHQQAYDLALGVYGDEHPSVGADMANLARDAVELGEVERARELYLASVRVREQGLGPDARAVGESLINLAVLEYSQLELGPAREHGERALAIFEKRLGPDHPYVGVAHNHLGTVAHAEKDLDGALAHYDEVWRIYEARYGAEHPRLAVPLTNGANVLLERGRFGEALARYDRAIAIESKALGDDHPSLAYEYLGKARALLGLGRDVEALPMAERALALREGKDFDAGEMSLTYFTLARALWQARGHDADARDRALQLARRALTTLREGGLDDAASVAESEREYETWLRERGGDIGLVGG